MDKTEAPAEIVRDLIRDPSRRKPEFLSAPDMDKVLSAIMRLGMEVSTLRDRVYAHEAILAKSTEFSTEDVDAFQASGDFADRLSRERMAFVEALIRDLT